MSINKLILDLTRKTKSIQRQLVKATEITVTDAIALLVQRVQESGIDDNGKPFKPYTEKYKKFKAGGSYISKDGQKKRRPNRTGNGLVNLTYTGEMLRSIGIIERKAQSGGVYFVEAGGRDKDTIEKIKGNIDNGQRAFMELSDKEQELLIKQWGQRIAGVISELKFR